MKLDQLRRMALFAMVAQEGSFTAVSERQNIATSAVSAAITKLEQDLGVRLLHRSTRQLSLTDEGRIFLQHCQGMLTEATNAHEALGEMTGKLIGQLTITTSQLDAKTLVLPALTPMLQANPKLILNLIVDDRQIDLVAGAVDIAIRAGKLEDSSLVARSLGRLPEVLVAAPEYLQRQGVPQNIQDLSEHKIIAFSSFAQPQNITLLDAAKVQTTVRLQLGAQTDNVEMVCKLALAGLGIARLPVSAVKTELHNGDLTVIMSEFSLPEIHLYAVTAKRDLQPAKITLAIESIRQYIDAQRAQETLKL